MEIPTTMSKNILSGVWLFTMMMLLAASAVAAPAKYDFSGLGPASDGFKPQGDRFLVSENFMNWGTALYYDESGTSVSGAVIKGNGVELESFDLIDMEFSGYWTDTVSLTITASLAGGGSASATVNDFSLPEGEFRSLVNDMGADLSGFQNVTELTFDINAGQVYNVQFETITISNQQAQTEPGITPTVQASDLQVISIGATQAGLRWTNGSGTRRLVLMKQGNDGAPVVVDGSSHSANSDFGTAPDIGDGWKPVYRGTGDSVMVTGLSATTGYRLVVYEFDGLGGGEAYLTTVDTNALNLDTVSEFVSWEHGAMRSLLDKNFWAYSTGAIGPDGTSYVAHYNYDSDSEAAKRLTVSRWDGNNWSTHASFVPADIGLDGLNHDLSIAVDSSNTIHIALRGYTGSGIPSNRGVGYARYDGSWLFEVIEFNSHPSGWLNIYDAVLALDPSGVPHIQYKLEDADANQQHIKIASRTGGSWSIDTWHTGPRSGDEQIREFTLVTDSDGYLHVLYIQGPFTGERHLRYRTNASGSWVDTLLLSSSDHPVAVDLVVDSGNVLHGIFAESNSTYNTFYLTNATGSWQIDKINENSDYYPIGIAINSNDDMVIAAGGSSTKRLFFRASTSSQWMLSNASPVDSDKEGYTGITFSDDGEVLLAYANGLSSRPRAMSYYLATTTQAPTDINLSSTTVNQSGGINAVVGSLSTVDPDVGASHTYSLVSGTGDTDNGSFNISADLLRANNAAALVVGDYSVRVQTNNGTSTFQKAFTITVVDDIPPTVDSVSVPANGTYGVGQNLDLTVNLSEIVIVNDGGGTPRIALTIGAATRYADYISGSGADALLFRYTVQAGDQDTDGIQVATSLDLNGGTIRDVADNNLNATLNGIGDTSAVLVDTAPPTVSAGNISISGATGTGGAYRIADTVTATWNNTAGGDNNSVTVTSVTVDFTEFGGGSAVVATNSSDIWTATYTIVAGSIDATNRNVSVSATNANGTTTVADASNATVDNIAPTVTAANISISGATGMGGAYRIGDTVTAIWNDTAGGDNNSDIISQVSVDFSQFGGGAAVAATNNAGMWTAAYTIVAGTIDDINRNVAVTATDDAGNSTTTADTTNATVDNIAPTVTAGNISISGASGTGGVYIIGDTVTAAWNNTTGGDNNSDVISLVTIDFSQFGGGAAVAATNNAGVWTAGHTIVAGAIDASNRNVVVSATDDAGNITITVDTSNATVDNVVPVVDSVGVPANGTYVADEHLDFTVNTSESVIVDTGGGTPAIALTVGAATRHANYLSGSGTSALLFRYTVQEGDLDEDGIVLDTLIELNGGTLRDSAGNDADANLNAVGDTSAILVDTIAPDGHSVSFDSATINASQAPGISFTFADAEVGADYSYTISSSDGGTPVTGAGTIASASEQVSGIDVSGLSDGTLTLAAILTDPAGNAAPAVTDTATLDTLAPTPLLSSTAGGATNDAFTVNIDFGKEVSGFVIGDITVTNADLSAFADQGGGAYSVLVTPVVDGEVTLDVAAGVAEDLAGNASLAAMQFSIIYDATPPVPVFSSTESDPSNSTSFEVSLDFGEPVIGMQINQIAAGNATLSGLVDHGGGSYSLTVSPDDEGMVTLDYAAGQVQDEAGNDNEVASQFSLVHDITAPDAPSMPVLDSGSDSGLHDDDNITNVTQPLLHGTAELDTTVAVSSDIDGVLGTTSPDGDGNWNFTPGAPLSEGVHSLTATATDQAGNESVHSDALMLTIDVTAPDGHGVDFDEDPINAAGSTAASFTFSDAELGASYSYTIESDGGGSTVTGSGTIADADEQIAGIDISNLADGTVSLSVILADLAGNEAAPVVATATLATTAPEAPPAPMLDPSSDTGVSDSDGITNDTMPILSGTAEPDSTITVFSDIDGELGTASVAGSSQRSFTPDSELGTASVAGSGQWSFTPDSELTANVTHSFTVTATDSFGNESEPSPELLVTIDTEAAGVTGVAGPADGFYGTGTNLTFLVSFDEAVVVDSDGPAPQLALMIDGTTRYAAYVGSGEASTTLAFTYTVQSSDLGAVGLSLGSEILLSGGRITDLAGNDIETALSGVDSFDDVRIYPEPLPVPLFGLLGQWIMVLLMALAGWTASRRHRRRV
jgi:hypothetical protein